MINLFVIFVALQMPVRHVASSTATIYYSRDIAATVASTYLSVIEQIYVDDTTKFKIGLAGGLKVRLCGSAYEFSDLTGRDSIFSPLCKDGFLYILCQSDPNDTEYQPVLEDGVIRAMLDRLHGHGAPWWLIRSASVYISGLYRDCSPPGGVDISRFSDLEEMIQSASKGSELSDLCFYLGATGKFFDVKFGAGSVERLLREFQHETNFTDAVGKLFHVNGEQVESEWRDFVTNEANSK